MGGNMRPLHTGVKKLSDDDSMYFVKHTERVSPMWECWVKQGNKDLNGNILGDLLLGYIKGENQKYRFTFRETITTMTVKQLCRIAGFILDKDLCRK